MAKFFELYECCKSVVCVGVDHSKHAERFDFWIERAFSALWVPQVISLVIWTKLSLIGHCCPLLTKSLLPFIHPNASSTRFLHPISVWPWKWLILHESSFITPGLTSNDPGALDWIFKNPGHGRRSPQKHRASQHQKWTEKYRTAQARITQSKIFKKKSVTKFKSFLVVGFKYFY